MKFLLVAINAKYIHSNPAIYDLKAYAKEHSGCVELAEYTINQQVEEIRKDIYLRKPQAIGFSCYIWNIRYVKEVAESLRKIMPEVPIWFGGPEVSFDCEELLTELSYVTGIVRGEGEKSFSQLLAHYVDENPALHEICGLTFREGEKIIETPVREILDMSEIPFAYETMDDFEHKIVYYESSRGCPFSCSYCLSSVDKKLRFRNLDLVKKELQFFLDARVPQVKFVDRTFNCKKEHSRTIWQYLIDHDNGITNFHFEIAADLLEEEDFALMAKMRPGLIQLEIGVQSTNPCTLKEIRRTMDFEKVSKVVETINSLGRVHEHLDLIAGLPYEDIASFRNSFNDVYALKPEQLQLGFLKVLRGSYMYEKQKDYGLVYDSKPPYEVLSTNWLSYEDVIALKTIEEMVEVYYNSGQFRCTLQYAVRHFSDAYGMYEALGAYYETNGYDKVSHNRSARYEILYAFLSERFPEDKDCYRELLTYDMCQREYLKNRPSFVTPYEAQKEEITAFFTKECEEPQYLLGYEGVPYRKLIHMVDMEVLHLDLKKLLETGEKVTGTWYVLFDYQKRDPLTHNAIPIWIQKENHE